MQNIFGVKPQPPMEQVWLDTLLNVLKPDARRSVRRFTSADVQRLMAEPLDLVPRNVRAQSFAAATGSMTAKGFWLEQADGSFTLTPSGITALNLLGPEEDIVSKT
ncbi:hypothetical protein QLH51_04165 [Sphingomonas sp. 2R-10]|uniref:hypothetical protein n=1 Tax=Sphingomonas sp. 2R-10 TaxID=3045148 RepID=UPI0024B9E898|nr:hypothetical protein [Sphingomonas sp. 2R-10]MDJ0275999.1 hypothetical protein [Sphingomonas sp. 2R-10]